MADGVGYRLRVSPQVDFQDGWFFDSDFELPQVSSGAAVVNMPRGEDLFRAFLAVGGDGVAEGVDALNNIYEWQGRDFGWQSRPERLDQARDSHVAIGVPDDAINC